MNQFVGMQDFAEESYLPCCEKQVDEGFQQLAVNEELGPHHQEPHHGQVKYLLGEGERKVGITQEVLCVVFVNLPNEPSAFSYHTYGQQDAHASYDTFPLQFVGQKNLLRMENHNGEQTAEKQERSEKIEDGRHFSPHLSHLEIAVVEHGKAYGIVKNAKASGEKPCSGIGRTQHVRQLQGGGSIEESHLPAGGIKVIALLVERMAHVKPSHYGTERARQDDSIACQ